MTSSKLMSTKVIQSDTAANNDGFTGSQGQITFDSTNKKIRVHDGTTAGGHEIGQRSADDSTSIGAGSIGANNLATGAVTETAIATDAM